MGHPIHHLVSVTNNINTLHHVTLLLPLLHCTASPWFYWQKVPHVEVKVYFSHFPIFRPGQCTPVSDRYRLFQVIICPVNLSSFFSIHCTEEWSREAARTLVAIISIEWEDNVEWLMLNIRSWAWLTKSDQHSQFHFSTENISHEKIFIMNEYSRRRLLLPVWPTLSTVEVRDVLDVVNDHPKLCLMRLPPAPPVRGMIRLYNYHLSPHAQYLLASSLSRVVECDEGGCM